MVYETILSRYAPYHLARSDARILITRYDQDSVAATDEALIQLAFLVMTRRKQDPSGADSADGAVPAAFKLLTEQTGMFRDGDLTIVKINEQQTQVVAAPHNPYQFRAYVLLHEVFGHGVLLGDGDGIERLQQAFVEVIGNKSADPLLPIAAASVFHESFADVQSVLLWVLREESFKSFLDMVVAFRKKHARPISEDCHETLGSLDALSEWLLRGNGAEELALLRQVEPKEATRRIYRLARGFSETGLKAWLLENGATSESASDAVAVAHRLYRHLGEREETRTSAVRIELLDAERLRKLVSQTRVKLTKSEPTESSIVR